MFPIQNKHKNIIRIVIKFILNDKRPNWNTAWQLLIFYLNLGMLIWYYDILFKRTYTGPIWFYLYFFWSSKPKILFFSRTLDCFIGIFSKSAWKLKRLSFCKKLRSASFGEKLHFSYKKCIVELQQKSLWLYQKTRN